MNGSPLLVSRLITGWITGCIVSLKFLINTGDEYYTFGPNNNFVFIGISINTPLKYFYVVLYCFINTMIRSANHNIIQPWITLNIQDDTKSKLHIKGAHEIVTLNIIYTWFDWLIYINLLLSQIDMVIVEIISELVVTNLITRWYLRLS